jgi:hypothetical protein
MLQTCSGAQIDKDNNIYDATTRARGCIITEHVPTARIAWAMLNTEIKTTVQ